MVVEKRIWTALIAVSLFPQIAAAGDRETLKSREAAVPVSHWIQKACSGQSVRFSVYGTKTDRALQEFGRATGLRSERRDRPTGNARERMQEKRRIRFAKAEETFGMSPSERSARATWDYSNKNPKKRASCYANLSLFAKRYGKRLRFSNAPSGFFASLFGQTKPFHRAVSSRVQKLGRAKLAKSAVGRNHYFDGTAKASRTPAAASGGWFARLFGGGSRTANDAIREAKSRPRSQGRSLRTRAVPGPAVSAPKKSYGEEVSDWVSKKYDGAKRAFGSVAGGITENVNKISQWIYGTSVSGGRYVRKFTARVLAAWGDSYRKKIQITSASRFSNSGYRDYSDVHKGHKRGLTLDVGSKGAAENAKMLHALYKTGAPVSRMLHTNNAAVIAAAGRQYGSGSAYVNWLRRKLIHYPGHTGHIDVKLLG
jgi:hypothetical protein